MISIFITFGIKKLTIMLAIISMAISLMSITFLWLCNRTPKKRYSIQKAYVQFKGDAILNHTHKCSHTEFIGVSLGIEHQC